MSVTDYTDAFHNLILSQKLTTLLGSFPELEHSLMVELVKCCGVLQMSEILEHNGACSDRSVVILLVFLSSQLIVKKNMDQLNFHKLLDCNCQILERRRSNIECWTVNSVASSDQQDEKDDSNEDAVRKFKALQAWWREMAEKNYKSASKPLISTWQSFSTSNDNINLEKGTRVGQAVEGIVKQSEAEAKIRGNAAQVIQSHFRRWIQRRNFLKMRTAVSFLQIAIRVSLEVKFNSTLQDFDTENVKHSEIGRYVKFIVEKHGFGRLKKSVLFIQRATRTWISHKRLVESMHNQGVSSPYLVSGAMDVQTCVPSTLEIEKTPLMYQEKGDRKLETEAALKIQLAWRNFTSNKSLHKKCVAATKVQSHFRGWQLRQRFLVQKQATIKIQSHFRCVTCQRTFQQNKVVIRSAIVIQSCIRGWIARRRASRLRYLIVIIQRHFRGWLIRRDLLFQRKAVIKIQSAIRCLICKRAFHFNKTAAIEVQRFVRGQITRRRLLGGTSCYRATTIGSNCNTLTDCFQSFELGIVLSSVLKLQRWWRHVLLSKATSVIIIQSHIRGWAARKKVSREKHRVVVIQSYWKGYLTRKESSRQMLDLRLRVQKSATNVDDGMRIINRLVSALSELLNMKSVSGILHTCATLDMTTQHSQKCCEKLVAAGAIDTLLELIRSVSRSIPDQEVLKHALSTLRNLACHPHLIEALIDSRGSVETILWEMLRNKDEGYFIACEILKKICSNHKGVEAICKLCRHVKRLNTLVEELTRKANMERRNPRSQSVRENLERRLNEAVELMKLLKHG
ncbi:hypothetical protein Pint_10934 [Pistacia integerrima]|uniref:Uncharacterized protein n=1 Tax=Pistacia integerrima TaxID=434235 RepID=A0ACC0XKC6_9ROSI|nr:hypothetical protein Pint_10934 [Pistacia integerrima]